VPNENFHCQKLLKNVKFDLLDSKKCQLANLVHFPVLLSNYNGMTACICRRFIPTTAFLIAYVSGQYRTTRTRYKVCWFIHQVEFEGQDGWKCFFFSYGCSRLTEKWKRTWENQLLLSAGKCRQRWHCVHCGMEDIWRVLLLWLVIFWVLCAKVVGATSVWVFFGVSQKWLCLAITQTYTNRFWQFLAKCSWESMQSNGILFSHLI